MAKRTDRNLLVGLDIGTSKVVAIVGEVKADGQLEIIGIGSHPSRGLKKGVVVNIESTVQSIQRAVEEAELMAGCEIHSVYAGIAGSHVRSLNSHGIVAIKDKEVVQGDVERVIDPGHRFDGPLYGVEVCRHESSLRERRGCLLDLTGRDALKAAVHRDHPDRPVQRPGERGQRADDERQESRAAGVAAPLEHEFRPLPCALRRRLGAVLVTVVANEPVEIHLRSREKLVSRTRHTSSPKSMPAWRAAMGTKL